MQASAQARVLGQKMALPQGGRRAWPSSISSGLQPVVACCVGIQSLTQKPMCSMRNTLAVLIAQTMGPHLWGQDDDPLHSAYGQIIDDSFHTFDAFRSGDGCIALCAGINISTQADDTPIDFNIDFRCRGQRIIGQRRLDTD